MTSPADALVTREFPATDPESGAALDHVALVTLNRPAALNALNRQLMTELLGTLQTLDADPECHCIVIRGAGDRAFAAGADIKEMATLTPASLAVEDDFARWDEIGRLATPLIAAVRGYALGGGCELAMACDIIVAGDDARFGQPEVTLGIIPGAGGTQRLTRAIGKARAMELILTGRTIDADEAHRIGLVSSVVPAAETLARAAVLTGEAAVTLGATNEGLVAGDLVNTAARLQSVAPPGVVLVGESTHHLASKAIAFERAGEQTLKGKSSPVPAWRALRVVAREAVRVDPTSPNRHSSAERKNSAI
jgi:enoyl-CoA hydratase